MGEAGEVIARLVARGLSGAQIGSALGRDRSLISQVRRGVKPGRNLAPALRSLEARLDAGEPLVLPDVERPARRRQAVRKRTTVGGERWGTSRIKRQAVKSGGQGLASEIRRADAAGQRVMIAVTFGPRTYVADNAGSKRFNGRSNSARGTKGTTVEWELNAAEAVEALDNGQSPVALMIEDAEQNGYVGAGADVVQVDLRRF